MTAVAAVDVGRLRRVSRLPFHWRGDRFELEALSRVDELGVLQAGVTFSRATTAAPADSVGTARTVVHSQPAWEIVDWDGDATRETPALLLGASDKVYWGLLTAPQELTAYLEFVENGTLAIASAAIAYIGNAGNTGARFWIDSTGSFYRVRHHNGTAERTATLAAAPSVGNRVALRAVLQADGGVEIYQSINGAAETSATDGTANTLASAWGDTRLYLGTTGDSNPGNQKAVRARVDLGSRTATQMQEAW